MPVILPHYFKSEVYKVEWAPVDGNKQNIGLYAVGEGNLILFDINKSPKGTLLLIFILIKGLEKITKFCPLIITTNKKCIDIYFLISTSH